MPAETRAKEPPTLVERSGVEALSPVPFLQCLGNFTLLLLLLQVLALVVELFPFRQSQFDLDLAILEVEAKGNQGVPLFADLRKEADDFLLVQQELAHP